MRSTRDNFCLLCALSQQTPRLNEQLEHTKQKLPPNKPPKCVRKHAHGLPYDGKLRNTPFLRPAQKRWAGTPAYGGGESRSCHASTVLLASQISPGSCLPSSSWSGPLSSNPAARSRSTPPATAPTDDCMHAQGQKQIRTVDSVESSQGSWVRAQQHQRPRGKAASFWHMPARTNSNSDTNTLNVRTIDAKILKIPSNNIPSAACGPLERLGGPPKLNTQ